MYLWIAVVLAVVLVAANLYRRSAQSNALRRRREEIDAERRQRGSRATGGHRTGGAP
jgi:cytochrome c-type biogenesis protein CcmH/NrfF